MKKFLKLKKLFYFKKKNITITGDHLHKKKIHLQNTNEMLILKTVSKISFQKKVSCVFAKIGGKTLFNLKINQPPKKKITKWTEDIIKCKYSAK